MTTAIVFDSEADALSYRQAIADLMGYPIEATPFGKGVHVERAQSLFYSNPIVNRDETKWAIIIDHAISPLVGQLQEKLPTIAISVLTLDETWFPPSATQP